MKIYLVLEEIAQPEFTDKYGEMAKPMTEIIGARRTREAAETLKERTRRAALNSDDDDEQEEVDFKVVTIQLPDA